MKLIDTPRRRRPVVVAQGEGRITFEEAQLIFAALNRITNAVPMPPDFPGPLSATTWAAAEYGHADRRRLRSDLMSSCGADKARRC